MSQFCKEKIFKIINFAKAPSQEHSQPSGLDTHPPYRAAPPVPAAQPETRGIHHRYRRDHNFATAAPPLPGAERRRRRRRRQQRRGCPAAYRPEPPARGTHLLPGSAGRLRALLAARARHSPRALRCAAPARRHALPASERRGRPAAVRAGQGGGRGPQAGRDGPPPARSCRPRPRRSDTGGLRFLFLAATAAAPSERCAHSAAGRCGARRPPCLALPRPVAAAAPSPPSSCLPPAAGSPVPAARCRRAEPAAAVPPSPAPRRAASGAIPSRGPGPAVPRRRRSHFLFLPPAGRAATCSPRGSGTCGDRTGPAAFLRSRLCLLPHGSGGEFPPSSLPLQYG